VRRRLTRAMNASLGSGEGRKYFFFEKKKQKTLGLFQIRASHHDSRYYGIAVRATLSHVSWFGKSAVSSSRPQA
jgi:hypothetical protein